MNLRNLIILALLAFGAWQWHSSSAVSLGPGVKVAEAPQQTAIEEAESFIHDDYRITPLADISFAAKVLSREDYMLDRESDLSPTDLALGWQLMSDESVLDQIDISQSGRWYRWRVKQFPIPRRAIETQSSNMHMVPADDHIANQLDAVRPGQTIEIEGQLIRAENDDGWRWKSSLSREDTGASACELVYVTALDIVTP